MDIKNYDGLINWLENSYNPDIHDDPVFLFVANSYQIFTRSKNIAADWGNLFFEFLDDSDSAVDSFLELQELFNYTRTDLLGFIGDITESTIGKPAAHSFQKTLKSAADKTNIASLRFLTAWHCINEGNLESCVQECEKIEQFYAPIFTIKGQAQLELGFVTAAIETLEYVCQQSPNEILAWFQLAKASHINRDQEKSWKALNHCHKLAPQSEEVALFMGMVAVESNNDFYQREALKVMEPHSKFSTNNSMYVLTLIELSALVSEYTILQNTIQTAQWTAILEDPAFYKKIGGILKLLASGDYQQEAASLLMKVSPPN